ncbi:hypothetical protein TNIN_237841 [Trichonephila inaurata madagascariensis]|uniref:Uncharacterized protein n=1 Tax=Trichonephila inaurata madagascariensis TaxID=2747483 RepID=A0A8X6YBB1_9ARAC|nr:hypothetical protein TNIN_237841 [Trichonephila inaurata madagascariensis]
MPPYMKKFSRESLREAKHLFLPIRMDEEVDNGYSTNEDARITPFEESNAETQNSVMQLKEKLLAPTTDETDMALDNETNMALDNETNMALDNETNVDLGYETGIVLDNEIGTTLNNEIDVPLN